MPDYKKCPNGHYYSSSLNSCPYCAGNAHAASTIHQNADDNATKAYGAGYTPTNDNPKLGNDDANKTTLIGGFANPVNGPTINPNNPKPAPQESNHTIFFTEDKKDENGNMVAQPRTRRKLVGWLVSYTLDDMGVDFKIYEGKNMVGRDAACNITIADPSVSGQHMLILFRDGKFSIRDQQSTHGTFVNGNDIDLDAVHLFDNDTIKIGNTVLKFRTAL